MKKLLNRMILPGITVAMLGLTTSAVAQWDNSSDGCGSGMRRDSGRMEQMRERRQAALHDKLKLSSEQEKAWQTFVARGRELRPKERHEPLEFAGLTAPQRMEKMLERMHEREGRMEKMQGALKEFYAVLTPQQQQIFNDAMPRPGERRMHRS
jgi:periplasmic protein CpxP/Spy